MFLITSSARYPTGDDPIGHSLRITDSEPSLKIAPQDAYHGIYDVYYPLPFGRCCTHTKLNVASGDVSK